MAPFKGHKFKYTDRELKDRHVGTTVYPTEFEDAEKWKKKKNTYTNEGVWNAFTKLRMSFGSLFTIQDGYIDQMLANKCAQKMMDTFLFRRANNENVQPPKEVLPVNAMPDDKEEEEKLDPAIWEGKKQPSANEELRWIFDNMKLSGVSPEDSPSAGSYALMLELQDNKEQRRDFYKTMWPKLLTKEDADKGGKLQDTGKDTIDLLDRLLKALPESEA